MCHSTCIGLQIFDSRRKGLPFVRKPIYNAGLICDYCCLRFTIYLFTKGCVLAEESTLFYYI